MVPGLRLDDGDVAIRQRHLSAFASIYPTREPPDSDNLPIVIPAQAGNHWLFG